MGMAVDVVLPAESQLYPNLGAEYVFKEIISIRGGYEAKQDVPAATFGLGLQNLSKDFGAGIDYAFTYQNAKGLAGIHRISLNVEF